MKRQEAKGFAIASGQWERQTRLTRETVGTVMGMRHQFKDARDLEHGGIWWDNYEHRVCEWTWNQGSQVLKVQCGLYRRRINLRESSGKAASEAVLKEYLPALALEVARALNDALDEPLSR